MAAWLGLVPKQYSSWVIGHEIGHLSVRSSERASDVESLLADAPGQRLVQATEVLADQHLYRGSGLTEEERASLAGFLVAALNAELHLKYCPARDVVQRCARIPAGVGVIFDYNSSGGLDVDTTRPHPEYVIRLVRLLELSRASESCATDALCILLHDVLDRVRVGGAR